MKRSQLLALFVVSALSGTLAVAQSVTLGTNIPLVVAGFPNTELNQVGALANGNYVIGGTIRRLTPTRLSLGYVEVRNPAGAVVWTRQIIGTPASQSVKLDRVRVLGDGSILVTCSGEAGVAVRFNGVNGNVIRSTRFDGPVVNSDIGPDGSAYFAQSFVDQITLLDETIGTFYYNGTRSRHRYAARKITLAGVMTGAAAHVDEYDYELSDAAFEPPVPIGRSFRFASSPQLKFCFYGSDVFMLGTHNQNQQAAGLTGEFGPTFDMMKLTPVGGLAFFVQNAYLNGSGDNVTFENIGMSAAGQIALDRTVQNGIGDTREIELFNPNTGSLITNVPTMPLGERRTVVGGFAHMTFENQFLPRPAGGSFAQTAKFSTASNTLQYQLFGNAVSRDATVNTYNHGGVTITVNRYRESNGTLLDSTTVNPVIVPQVVNGAVTNRADSGQMVAVGTIQAGNKSGWIQYFNQAPVLNFDSYSIDNVLVATGNVFANDWHVTGLTAQMLSGPTVGTVTLQPNGDFLYTAPNGFAGVATFRYKTTRAGFAPRTATVQINVS